MEWTTDLVPFWTYYHHTRSWSIFVWCSIYVKDPLFSIQVTIFWLLCSCSIPFYLNFFRYLNNIYCSIYFSCIAIREFCDEVCQSLTLYYCSRYVVDVKLSQLNFPFKKSPRSFWFLENLTQRIVCQHFNRVCMEVRPQLPRHHDEKECVLL